MTPGFTVFSDPSGDLYVVDGVVAQLRTGVRLAVGSGLGFSAISPSRAAGDFVPVSSALSSTFVGGSGRNLVATGLTSPPISGPTPPVGIFHPGRPNLYYFGDFVLGVAGASYATIYDGTAMVAELTTGGTAPVGNYVATAYGRTTYNGGSAFTIAIAAEPGGPGAIPDHLWTVSAGTAPGGQLTADDAANFTDSSDTDWTVIVYSGGNAALIYDGVTMATRDGGSELDPDGPYAATQDGADAFNSGEPWTAFITVSPRPPRAGFVYVKITESAGTLTTVAGPFFATSLPANTGSVYHVPIAQSDGSAIEQFHTGLLIWPDTGGGASTPPSGNGLVSVTSGAYDTPSTLRSRVAADAANLRSDMGASPTAGSTSLVTLGTVTIGTWNAGVIAGQYGGTGADNTGKTITLGGNLATTGAYNLTLALGASVTVTLPSTSATMARTDAAQTFSGVQTFSDAPVFTTMGKVSAYKNAADQSGSTGSPYTMAAGSAVIVVFDSESYDTGSNFASNVFTAPADCYVRVSTAIYVSAGTAGVDSIHLYKNGSAAKRLWQGSVYANSIVNGCATVHCAANDTLDIRYYGQYVRTLAAAASITWVMFEILP